MVPSRLKKMLFLDQISYGYGWKSIGSLSGSLSLSLPNEGPPITLISGRNGSGKTTFLRTVAGLLPLMQGRILWLDAPLEECQTLGGICYLGDGLDFFGDQTVLSILSNLQGHSPENQHLLELFALSPRMLWKKLSIGQKQKVRLCLVLRKMEKASLIILDEPFSGLDSESRQTAIDLLHLTLCGERKRLLICQHQENFPSGWIQNELHFDNQTFILKETAKPIKFAKAC